MKDYSYPNFGYDDDLIEASRRDGRPRVRVYRLSDTAVVLGSGSRSDNEVNLDACRADGVPILRRRGGGCAVVIDPGAVIVSVVVTGLSFRHQRRQVEKLTRWLVKGLGQIGFPGLSPAGNCDLVLGERKVGGACFYRSRDLLYYSASLLVDPDAEKFTRYLKHPPREPDYRAGRPHASFVGSLAAVASGLSEAGCGAEQIAQRLRRTLRPPDLRGDSGSLHPVETAQSTTINSKEARRWIPSNIA